MERVLGRVKRRRARWCAWVLVCGIVAPTGLAVLQPQPAQAEKQLQRARWVLGLKDPDLRNKAGADALLQRLRARLLAARLTEFDLRIDAKRGELLLDVTSDLADADLRRLLLAPGEVALWPVASGVEIFAELRDLLPEDVELVYGRDHGRLDVHLISPSRASLARFVDQLTLADHHVIVAPERPEDPASPWRTWLVARAAKPLGIDGLGTAQLHAGVHPAYYSVQAWWGEPKLETPSPDQLAGTEGLRALTEAAAPGALLLVVDGEVEAVVRVVQPIEDGHLLVRASGVTPEAQRTSARLLAGWLAAAPHPCDVVIVFDKR